jgi:hypothetical protein
MRVLKYEPVLRIYTPAIHLEAWFKRLLKDCMPKVFLSAEYLGNSGATPVTGVLFRFLIRLLGMVFRSISRWYQGFLFLKC